MAKEINKRESSRLGKERFRKYEKQNKVGKEEFAEVI